MTMVPAASGGAVGVRFSQGEAAMVSGGERGAVMLEPLRFNGSSQRLAFKLAAFNRSGAPVNFGAENVTIELDDGSAVPVHNFDMLRDGAKAEARGEAMAALVAAGIDIAHAYRERRSDPARSREMARDAIDTYDYRLHSIAENLTYSIATMGRYVLQTTTIDPKTYWGGAIIADQPVLSESHAERARVTVDLAGEAHHFILYLAQEGAPVPHEVNLPAVWRGDMQALQATPATWLYDAPPAPPVQVVYIVGRF
jgi:hypothetical protein